LLQLCFGVASERKKVRQFFFAVPARNARGWPSRRHAIFSAGLCTSIEPHMFFGKILKNSELARAKDDLGSPRKFSSNPRKIFDEVLPRRGKGTQIQIQEEIEIVRKPSIAPV
jgi:hypothetical protein